MSKEGLKGRVLFVLHVFRAVSTLNKTGRGERPPHKRGFTDWFWALMIVRRYRETHINLFHHSTNKPGWSHNRHCREERLPALPGKKKRALLPKRDETLERSARYE